MQPDNSGQRTHKNTFVAHESGQIKRLSEISFPGFLDASYAVFASFCSGNRFIGETGIFEYQKHHTNPDRERPFFP
jgi:hypothetical protein